MTDEIRKALLDLRARQESGEHMPCPRCGRDTMKPKVHTNALSRYANIKKYFAKKTKLTGGLSWVSFGDDLYPAVTRRVGTSSIVYSNEVLVDKGIDS